MCCGEKWDEREIRVKSEFKGAKNGCSMVGALLTKRFTCSFVIVSKCLSKKKK